jgi:DNA-directed RNA polymerase subunit RPC12/RpoP
MDHKTRLKIRCPACGHAFEIAPDGRQSYKCPECKRILTVVGASDANTGAPNATTDTE